MSNYYVYVYIDPRNHEEFYYGKGFGSRKDAHLNDHSDTEKARRISAIKKEGLDPIIRVIARNLSEQEALLVEKTLLWKLGKWTTNIATGHFADKFRPHDTLHKELPKFDFQSGIYYYNVGESIHRNWDDYKKFRFISAGQAIRFRDAMLGFNEGDVIVAYLKRRGSVGGFVGIGIIIQKAKQIKDIVIQNKPLLMHDLTCERMSDNCDDHNRSEYVALVEWIKTAPRNEAKWRSKPKLFTSTLVRASLDNQPQTVKFLEEQFNIKINDLVT